ncbi:MULTISPECIES: TetR/AcrR family transcriptional regulator [Amycolatopsis]|uniref:TetR/AcrR family transcriptional regulator n=1 Tax=Amycolatopsis dendrobii TaxID=2760662 RepID=A0A7W3W134_9PSEU|nr:MULTISPECIES: TetR/AcrR family transcriptional regulator [Amycolatopsis]MBB1156875.1 TetR/AcrR family transcriptional regulator [Amycolatopsis dendrobii]UKD53579.1 TetR/AcrR family transcriptional regulator [Amycolatopsis sp. FU40]
MGSREEIVAAAAAVMREQGYAHATTKAIAQASGYSEALLYKHFRDKTALFLAVLKEELPDLAATAARLTEHPEKAGLGDNLAELATTALAFYCASFPISVSIFSSRELLRTHRDTLENGPDLPIQHVAGYLAAEVKLGRLRADLDVEAAARLLLGACFQEAFLASFEERPPRPGLAQQLVETLEKLG